MWIKTINMTEEIIFQNCLIYKTLFNINDDERNFEENLPHPSSDPNAGLLNSLRPRLNRHPFADNIFKCIFLNENEWILSRISLNFVPKARINNIPSLVQIMAWCLPGDKPLSEPMMVSLLTHICVTRPQWVNLLVKRPQNWVRTITDSMNWFF